MNEVLFPVDVVNVINSFLESNKGDHGDDFLIIQIGCELLDVSEDKLMDLIEDMKRGDLI